MSEPFALDIKELTKNFGEFRALNGIDLQVKPGDFFALLGPNGAGKSTTISIICSLVRKTSGTVFVFGNNIDSDFAQAKKCLGVVPQEFNFNVFEKVRDILINQAGYYGMPRKQAEANSDKYLKKLGLWDKRETPSRALSGGMKRRLMIARALVHEPKLLILDEPTAGVDIELRRSMWSFLQEINADGTTIILTTHYLEEAEQLCRNVGIIDHGEIVENTSVKSLLSQLNHEVFILDVQKPLPEDFALPGRQLSRIDETTIEITIEKGQSVNDVFISLSELDVQVASMRNKVNRLEELFVSLVQSHKQKRDKEALS